MNSIVVVGFNVVSNGMMILIKCCEQRSGGGISCCEQRNDDSD